MSADLERDLRALGERLDWPQAPDFAARLDLPPRRSPRRWLVAAVAAAAILVPAGVAVGDDVLRWLGLAGVEVERTERLPVGVTRELGPRVTLEEAARRAGFAPVVPRDAPDAVRVAGGVITLVYGDVIVAQTAGTLDGGLLRKVAPEVERVRDGLWFDGDHAYLYLRPDGEVAEAHAFRAGPTFVTRRGDVVIRVEGPDLTLARARVILR